MPQGSKFSLTQTPRIGLVVFEAPWDPTGTLTLDSCDQEIDRRIEDSNSYIPAQLQNGYVWVNIVRVCVANAADILRFFMGPVHRSRTNKYEKIQM